MNVAARVKLHRDRRARGERFYRVLVRDEVGLTDMLVDAGKLEPATADDAEAVTEALARFIETAIKENQGDYSY